MLWHFWLQPTLLLSCLSMFTPSLYTSTITTKPILHVKKTTKIRQTQTQLTMSQYACGTRQVRAIAAPFSILWSTKRLCNTSLTAHTHTLYFFCCNRFAMTRYHVRRCAHVTTWHTRTPRFATHSDPLFARRERNTSIIYLLWRDVRDVSALRRHFDCFHAV